MIELNRIYNENCLDTLKRIPDNFIDCCITSPPYWGLRDYGTAKWEGGDPNCDHRGVMAMNVSGGPGLQYNSSDKSKNEVYTGNCRCGAVRIDQQIGLEKTPEEYVSKIVDIFREVRRVLKDTGTLWLNLGDTYYNYRGKTDYQVKQTIAKHSGHAMNNPSGKRNYKQSNLKDKDLVGIPWMVAFALRSDGWYLRSDIIWCLSGGTYVYAKTQRGIMPVMVRDLIRLKLGTIQLWNGEKWTKVLGISKSERKGSEIEFVLRSGERISCTSNHQFPTQRGLIKASEIVKGDNLIAKRLPEKEDYINCVIDKDAAWLAGLYIAEGSMAGDTIQIAGHSKETERWDRLRGIVTKFGGHITRTIKGNCMHIRLYGKILNAIINELVSGRTAVNKCFAPMVWNYSNEFISEMLNGYLSGDGHWDEKNNRWRLGFCRNYNLERDLRVACARLDYHLKLSFSTVKYKAKDVPTFKGEIRKTRSGHFNQKNMCEVVDTRKARCRYVYDIGVEDEPHLFSLASGVLTHNSKPNPMPESVTDRCTKSHEYIFLMAKSAKYYYDNQAIAERSIDTESFSGRRPRNALKILKYDPKHHPFSLRNDGKMANTGKIYETKNKRSVWTVNTYGFPDAHFATFPEKLIEPCVLAGCPEEVCSRCGNPVERIIDREKADRISRKDNVNARGLERCPNQIDKTKTIGFGPTCTCGAEFIPGIIYDPFMGAGTVAKVALQNYRKFIGSELNPDYCKISNKRIKPSLHDWF